MNVLKEIEVTPYFLGLDQTTRFCQNEEMFESCTTRQYIDTLLEQCGCLPFNIRMSDKVLFRFLLKNLLKMTSLGSALHWKWFRMCQQSTS